MSKKIDIFGDGRKIPTVFVNIKVKIKTKSLEEMLAWNKVFGYIMKKPRTKLEFITVANIRKLKSLDNVTLNKIKKYISVEDYQELSKVEDIFNSGLTLDIKAFILSILKVPFEVLLSL
jgi:hypothetical protein